MSLSSEYKYSYRGISISGAAILLLSVAGSPYLRFCCVLTYLLNTEAEVSDSDDIGSTEGDKSFLSDTVVPCI